MPLIFSALILCNNITKNRGGISVLKGLGSNWIQTLGSIPYSRNPKGTIN